jgi:hypothetical protein
MLVEILMEVSDEQRKYAVGDLCDFPDDKAVLWVKGGFARGRSAEPEAATLESEENAAMPRGRKRG